MMMERNPFLFLLLLISSSVLPRRSISDTVTPREALLLRDEVQEMFYHAFNGYMEHAFPKDELRPLSCEGEDTLGSYALTLIDSLDTLALLGNRERFTTSVEWIGKNLQFNIELICMYRLCSHFKYNISEALKRTYGNYTIMTLMKPQQTILRILVLLWHDANFLFSPDEFDDLAVLLMRRELHLLNKTVSVFETTIRVLGGLLSAHLIASDYATGMRIPSYEDQLLHLAEDLARRLLPAFDTPTGIPFGSVNLLYGVDEHESKITSTAGGATLTLEFGILSRLTNDPVFEEVTKNAVRGLWARRSKLDLVGAHINVFTGEWTQKDAGIGTSIDSFYEYLLKAYLLFGDEEYLYIFQEAYGAAMHYLHNDPWYVEVNMDSGAIVWPLFNSLQAFWPGLQVLAGDVDPAIRTHTAFFSVWKRYGFTPEGFNLATLNVQNGQRSYPLRPELIESTYWLYKATRDPRYLDAGRDMITSLQYGARCPCGYCHISDVELHQQEDHMESFFLAETVKYLWLLFDLAAGPDNLVENGPYQYIFSTEGHLFPATPLISLVREHCSYLGAFCWSGDTRTESHSIESLPVMKKSNGTKYFGRYGGSSLASSSNNANHVSGLIKGGCPRLTHGQKFGITYMASPDNVEVHSNDLNEYTGGGIHGVISDLGLDSSWIDNDTKSDDIPTTDEHK